MSLLSKTSNKLILVLVLLAGMGGLIYMANQEGAFLGGRFIRIAQPAPAILVPTHYPSPLID